MKKLKSGDTHAMDRLSELPNSLILKILSCLEMRDVVRTTSLSKRWNDLWTTVPRLCFKSEDLAGNVEEFRKFISQALLLWKGCRIQKFKIVVRGHHEIEDGPLYRDMNRWLRFVTEKKPEELCLCLPFYEIDHCLCECSSIRKLSLVECGDIHILGDVRWDQLKSLKIECFSINEDVINCFVSGAPQLEIFELSIISDDNVNLSIRSCSLKKLSIRLEDNLPMHAVLTIWAPNLETLILSCPYRHSKCLLMDVSSLTDATLDFKEDVLKETNQEEDVLGETLRQILSTFQHVEALTLSSCCFKVLAVMKGKYSFSPLSNVKLLRLSYATLPKPDEIVGLLEIFPKVKMLDISLRCTVYSKDYPVKLPENSEVSTIKSLMMQLRTVKICWDVYEKPIFHFIEFFFKHAAVLERIVIQKRGFMSVQLEEMILVAEKLLSLQRSFPTVELIFGKN